MEESWISVLTMVAFFILPLIFGKRKAKALSEQGKGDFQEFLSELGLDEDEQEFDAEPEREIYVRPVVRTKVVPKEVKPKVADVPNEADEVRVGRGMSKEEKRKLIIYSEVMSPKYKEY
jgi:hypothetical protein